MAPVEDAGKKRGGTGATRPTWLSLRFRQHHQWVRADDCAASARRARYSKPRVSSLWRVEAGLAGDFGAIDRDEHKWDRYSDTGHLSAINDTREYKLVLRFIVFRFRYVFCLMSVKSLGEKKVYNYYTLISVFFKSAQQCIRQWTKGLTILKWARNRVNLSGN